MQADVSAHDDLRARHDALEAKVSQLSEALQESEAQRAALKRASPAHTRDDARPCRSGAEAASPGGDCAV